MLMFPKIYTRSFSSISDETMASLLPTTLHRAQLTFLPSDPAFSSYGSLGEGTTSQERGVSPLTRFGVACACASVAACSR